MGPAPAAAARTARGRQPSDLDRRLRALLARSPGDDLAERLLPATPSPPSRPRPEEGFYWLRVAGWLAESLGLSAKPAGRELLAELQWIQYCVYCAFRVQDDLVDGEVADPRLAVQTNHLLVEAARVAARRFEGDSPFWVVFSETIDATSRAIVSLDRLQRAPERAPHADLGLYVDLAACLKIAAGGVAFAAGREDDWRRRISPALDRLAIAAQIVDDLHDLRDDLAEGRINYAAWWMCRPIFASTPEAIEAVVASQLAAGERLPALLASAGRLLSEATAILTPAVCPSTHAFLREYRDGLGGLAAGVDASRLALLAPKPATAARRPRIRPLSRRPG